MPSVKTLSFFLLCSIAVNAQVKFLGVTSLNVPSTPYELANGDFNKDGRLDLVTANFRIGQLTERL